MTECFDAYWHGLVSKNDGLRNLDAKMTMSVEEFRKRLAAAFQAGSEVGTKRTERAKSIFDRVFGKLG